MAMRHLLLTVLFAATLSTPLAHAASIAGGPIVNPANGHIYYLLTADTWTNSETEAQALGGNLVTINDAAENTFVFDTFAQGRDVWIGFNDAASEGNFVWAGGETPSFTNWRGGQPDNFSTPPVIDEDYGMMYGTGFSFSGKWNDAANDPSVYAGFTFANEVSNIQGVVEVVPLPSAAKTGLALLAATALFARPWRRKPTPA